jgi:flagellar basal body P-ring formation protein FlgA
MKKLTYYPLINKIFAFCCSSLLCIAAQATNNVENIALADNAAKFIEQQLINNGAENVEVEASAVDARINVPVCADGITYTVNPESLFQANITVKASCASSAWYMFLVVHATEIQPVVVVSSALSPGTLLSSENLQVINMDKKRLRSTTFADIDGVIGARIKRRITAGRPVEPDDLCFVCKGDRIVIGAGSANMQVKTNGIALEDGKLGESIRVKNARSNKDLVAQVVSTSEVKVNF